MTRNERKEARLRRKRARKVIPPVGDGRAIDLQEVSVEADCNVTVSSVTLRVLTDEEGYVVRSDGAAGVDWRVKSAVATAVRAARVEPARRDGLAVAAWMDLVVPLPSTDPGRACSGESEGRDWPRLYADYLDAVCRGAQTYVLESATDLGTWDFTFSPPFKTADSDAFGASWYSRCLEESCHRLNLTRLRVLRNTSGTEPLELVLEGHARKIEPRIYARQDAHAAGPDCDGAESYLRNAPARRAKEKRNLLRLTDPLSVHDGN